MIKLNIHEYVSSLVEIKSNSRNYQTNSNKIVLNNDITNFNYNYSFYNLILL